MMTLWLIFQDAGGITTHMHPDDTIPKKYQKGIVAPQLVDGYPVLSNEASQVLN